MVALQSLAYILDFYMLCLVLVKIVEVLLGCIKMEFLFLE